MKICNRDLEKCRIIELGPDWRLSIAHNAALQSATAAFAADGFGGALVGQSLVALWFSTKFGLNLNSLSLVFFSLLC